MNIPAGAGRLRTPAALFFALSLLVPRALLAQEHEHERREHERREHDEHEDHHRGALHFSHPLVAESVTPDTKVRLDTHIADAGGASTLELVFEAEYAFAPAFSIEVGTTPYVHNHIDPAEGAALAAALPVRAHLATPLPGQAEDAFSDLDVALKFANFAFAEHGLLLGYGATLGIPMRTEEGEPAHVIANVEPFLDIGYQQGIWEISGFARFGIPTGREDGEPGNADLVTNLAALAHVTDQVQALLEMDSSSPLGGGEDPKLVHLTPGVKVQPIAGEEHLIVGAGLRVPISETKVFDRQWIASVFWHF